MSLLNRVSNLVSANLNHLLDKAEDPEVMLKDLIREMEASIVELRRETVAAIAREKRLAKRMEAVEASARDFESKAALALDHGNEELARRMLAEKVRASKSRETMVEPLEGARRFADKLRGDLARMEAKVDEARRKKDDLLQRKRAAEARLKTEDAVRRSSGALGDLSDRAGELGASASAFEAYADAILDVEAQAEAAQELSGENEDPELELNQMLEASEIDRELSRLKERKTR